MDEIASVRDNNIWRQSGGNRTHEYCSDLGLRQKIKLKALGKRFSLGVEEREVVQSV